MDAPRILTFELKGEVGKRWSDAEGVYSICPSLINGKPWWQQELASNALWYDKTFQNWKIGDTGDRGGSDCKMFTLGNTARDPPHIATPWKYMINGEWSMYPGSKITLKIFAVYRIYLFT